MQFFHSINRYINRIFFDMHFRDHTKQTQDCCFFLRQIRGQTYLCSGTENRIRVLTFCLLTADSFFSLTFNSFLKSSTILYSKTQRTKRKKWPEPWEIILGRRDFSHGLQSLACNVQVFIN